MTTDFLSHEAVSPDDAAAVIVANLRDVDGRLRGDGHDEDSIYRVAVREAADALERLGAATSKLRDNNAELCALLERGMQLVYDSRVETCETLRAEAAQRAAAAAALVQAIRAFTVDMPNDQPNGPAEEALLKLEYLLGAPPPRTNREWVASLNGVCADLCAALADNTKALRIAAEAHFGGNFKAPVCPMCDGQSDPRGLCTACCR